MMSPYLISDTGQHYYKCYTGLSSFRRIDGKLLRTSTSVMCETIRDENGQVIPVGRALGFYTGIQDEKHKHISTKRVQRECK